MDFEKGMKETMGAPDGQVPPMCTEGEPMLPDLNVQTPVEGGVVVAGKMKPGVEKWQVPYWVLASSVIFLTNSIHSGPKYKLQIPQEAAASMVVFLCAICSIFCTMLSK